MDGPRKNLTKVQKIIRQSSSGRKIKTPKALLPTSSDEAPHKNKLSVGLSASIKDHIIKLKGSLSESLNVIQPNQLRLKSTTGSKTSNSTPKTNDPPSKHKQSSTTKPSSSAKKLHKNNTDETLHESPVSEEQLPLAKPKPSSLISKPSGEDLYEQNADITISDSLVANDQLSQFEVSAPSSSGIDGLASSSKHCRLMTRNQLHLSNWDADLDVQGQKENFHEDFADFRKRVENSLLNLKNQGEALNEKVEKVIGTTDKILKLLVQRSGGREKLTQNLYRKPEGFPLSSIEQFYQLEQNEDKLTELYDYLQHLGGAKVREFLNCALKTVMTDQIVCEFNWKKLSGSEEFGNTATCSILYEAAKDCPLFVGPQNVTEFKCAMQEVLRSTKQRCRNAQKSSVSEEEDDIDPTEAENPAENLFYRDAGDADEDDSD